MDYIEKDSNRVDDRRLNFVNIEDTGRLALGQGLDYFQNS